MTPPPQPLRPPPPAGDPGRWPCLAPAAGGGSLLLLAAAPGSRRTGADGLHDGCLRVRLTAPAVDGRANDALIAWLAAELGLPRRGVRLLRGAASRRKQLAVDAPPAAVAHWLSSTTAAPPA